MTLRYSMNVWGAPAMTRKELAQHRRDTFIGVSLTANAPVGQYDSNVVVNVGTNRWAFKPEVGVSRALGRWALEGAFGAWLYAKNRKFRGDSERTQSPLWSTQAHLVRILNRRHWAALDFTYFAGGGVKINGRPAVTSLANTRLGATYGYLVSPRQALRFSYFSGVTTRVGSDVSTVGVAYQFLWSTGR